VEQLEPAYLASVVVEGRTYVRVVVVELMVRKEVARQSGALQVYGLRHRRVVF